MKRAMKAFAAMLAALLPLSAGAVNTWGTDLSDLWWNANESGWGANIAHQNNTLFLTLFVYGPDGRARWYVGSALVSLGGANLYTFRGPLYETNGPAFSSSFNPSAVGVRQVGTATFVLGQVTNATLTYSVDGVTVTKAITRQTFGTNNLAGVYVGAAMGSATNCGTDSGAFENTAVFTISHSGTRVNITAAVSNGLSCTYSLTYTQSGRLGTATGTINCSNGAAGNFTAFEIEAGYNGFFSRFNADYGGGCREVGRIVGMKR